MASFERLDRHSGAGIRGDPKKGGGGGKGTWGRPGDELRAVSIADDHDPNYDSEQEENVKFEVKNVEHLSNRDRSGSYTPKAATTGQLDLDGFKNEIKCIMEDYLLSGDITEAAKSIKDLNAPHFHDVLVKRAVTLSLDRAAPQQEAASALITLLFTSKILTAEQIWAGFKILFAGLDDLSLDVPDAPDLLLQFVACAIKDGCLSPAFVARIPEPLLERGRGKLIFQDICKVAQEPEALSAYKKKIQGSLAEYFVSGDIEDIRTQLQELGHAEFHPEFVKKAVQLALERRDKERELASILLSSIYSNPVSAESMSHGFDRLLDSIEDLSLDVPDAPRLVAQFLARAVVDEIIPPAYVTNHARTTVEGTKVASIISQTQGLLNMSHATIRLAKIWGPGDGRPVDEVKREVEAALQEYLSSNDVEELVRWIQELNSPYFHHEVVKKAVTMSMEKQEKDRQAVTQMLRTLVDRQLISPGQVTAGFDRVKDSMNDLKLDIPAADDMFSSFVARAKEQHVLPAAY
eukprot:GILK01000679.1.p1 GENE.GILK01000679.1~~GILK01000679.1.p1  ORF type:complete len:520 (-),score=122.84 GILK01000679.1:331-1890(-)